VRSKTSLKSSVKNFTCCSRITAKQLKQETRWLAWPSLKRFLHIVHYSTSYYSYIT